MSQYKIYRVDEDPVILGKRRKRLNYIFAAGAIVVMFLAILVIALTEISPVKINLMIWVVMYPSAFLTYLKLRHDNRQLKNIGSIEFNQSGITKKIGEITSEYNYSFIEALELEKHIPAASPSEGKSGYFTHILSIYFKDLHKENLVVSDRPLGKWRDLSIVETMKTLKRIVPLTIIIK